MRKFKLSRRWLTETSQHITGHVIGGIVSSMLALVFSSLVLKSAPQITPHSDHMYLIRSASASDASMGRAWLTEQIS
jgi:hypothetical protein